MQPLSRSLVVGKTLVGMRVDDTIRAINWLASRPDVDNSSIILYGKGRWEWWPCTLRRSTRALLSS